MGTVLFAVLLCENATFATINPYCVLSQRLLQTSNQCMPLQGTLLQHTACQQAMCACASVHRFNIQVVTPAAKSTNRSLSNSWVLPVRRCGTDTTRQNCQAYEAACPKSLPGPLTRTKHSAFRACVLATTVFTLRVDSFTAKDRALLHVATRHRVTDWQSFAWPHSTGLALLHCHLLGTGTESSTKINKLLCVLSRHHNFMLLASITLPRPPSCLTVT